jgi:hypothetical protein
MINRLRALADPIDQQILDEAFSYESSLDCEFACCHSALDIEAGKCTTKPEDIPIVKLLAGKYGVPE